jgi:outer membrane PBP1 activator LpoA protein
VPARLFPLTFAVLSPRPRARRAARRTALATVVSALYVALLPLSASAQAPATQPAAQAAPASPSAAPSAPAAVPAAAPAAPNATPPAAAAPITVTLLLPPQTSPFARAAEVVRQGAFAAQAVGGTEVTLQVVEVDDRPERVQEALLRARERGAQVVLGPLTRTQVAAAAQTRVPLPMVMLNHAEQDGGALPTVLALGLTIEQEVRVLVRGSLRQLVPSANPTLGGAPRLTPRVVIVAGESPLARRATAALRDALRDAGERYTLLSFAPKFDALAALGERIGAAQPEAIYLALDAREAAIARPRLPREVPIFGTSQVNLGGAEGALLAPDLEGVMFVDAPWLLEPDHPAVMVYAKPAQPLSAELQRLYALGIDGYRLAVEWAGGRSQFTLDGVTGWLQVDRARSARVERWPSFAVFRGGRIERIEVAR